MDCYLLVAPTGDIVANRTLILPQLAAPGIDIRLVKKETGWRCKFGPVYAKDISQYVANGFKKTDAMHRVQWDLMDRLDIGIGLSFPILLLLLVIMSIFLGAWLFEFAAWPSPHLPHPSADHTWSTQLQISGDDQRSRLRGMEMRIDTHKATILPALPITPLMAHPVVVVFESPLDVILPESTLVENFRWY